MKRLIVFVLVLFAFTVLAMVPITADFALLVNDFSKLNELLPENMMIREIPSGFLCFFGKLTLNVFSLFEVVESEDVGALKNVAEFAVVSNDATWVKTYLSQVVQNHEMLEKNELYYFVGPSMMEDVKAMIEGELASMELNTDATIYGRIRSIPVLGIVFHLLGFSEGTPLEDEFALNVGDESVNILIRCRKTCKSDWELAQLANKTIPQGLKMLPRAEVGILVPVFLLKQLPEEIMEELGLSSMEGVDVILSKATFLTFNVSQAERKLLVSFDLEKDEVQEILGMFKEEASEIRQEEQYAVIQLDEITLKLPLEGGVALLYSNVSDQEMLDVEPGTMAKFMLLLDGSIVDVAFFREGCSPVLKAKVSTPLLKEFLSQIVSEFMPTPDELKMLQRILETIDDAYYYENRNPPEDLQALRVLLGERFVEVPEEIFYSRREENGTLLIEVGIRTPLALSISENEVRDFIGYSVDSVKIDRENLTVSVIMKYEKLEVPSADKIIRDLVGAFKSYVADFDELPQNIEDVLTGYTWLPFSVMDMISYEIDSETGTVTLKLMSDEDVGGELVEELSLEKLFREDGNIVVIFKVK
ncbi:hypothetical protein AS159_01840 [Thermotoga sp. Ku-13t]|uniref:hypothetical protein n=1 Tax=Thermotoga sp. Ku-13t TaxID=1755813 RepID=UPI0013EA133E|nr:hypothetical protein [Thermotoga sp. Ku-13t]KAF2958467.1 hypothetical protein AS159_01840 [Thermotoga sp. Ku-13t]